MVRTKHKARSRSKKNAKIDARIGKQFRRIKKQHVVRRIKYLQKHSMHLAIPRLPFGRLVKEIAQGVTKTDLRWKEKALEALQCASEALLISLFEAANVCALHGKRKTVMLKDIQLVNNITKGDLSMLNEQQMSWADSQVSAKAPAKAPSQVSAAVSAKAPAKASSQVSAKASSQVSAAVSAQAPAQVSAQAPAKASAQAPAVSFDDDDVSVVPKTDSSDEEDDGIIQETDDEDADDEGPPPRNIEDYCSDEECQPTKMVHRCSLQHLINE